MNTYDVRRFALIMAEVAEIEGMKAHNKERELNGGYILYDQTHFDAKADRLRDLAASHDEQL